MATAGAFMTITVIPLWLMAVVPPVFQPYIAQFREEPVTIIILANREDFDTGACTLKIARQVLGLPAIVREPVTLSAADQDRILGKYMVDNQWPLAVVKEDDGLFLKTEKLAKLLPLSENTFYLEADLETELTFAEEKDGKFQQLTGGNPLFSYTAFRATAEQDIASE